jgi:hypothetical protein
MAQDSEEIILFHYAESIYSHKVLWYVNYSSYWWYWYSHYTQVSEVGWYRVLRMCMSSFQTRVDARC